MLFKGTAVDSGLAGLNGFRLTGKNLYALRSKHLEVMQEELGHCCVMHIDLLCAG